MERKAQYINLYKGFAIVCMVISRVVFIDARITNLLGAFCICMLYVAEGASIDIKARDNISRMAKKFMVPYAAFSLVIIFNCCISILLKRQEYDVTTLKTKLLDTATLYGDSVLWILSAMFVGMMIYIYIRNMVPARMVLLGSAVLMAAFLVCGNIFDFIHSGLGIVMAIILRLFAVLWRAVFACMFIAIGEMMGSLLGRDNIHRKRNITVPVGFILVIIGTVVAVYNSNVSVAYLRFGSEIMFYGSTIMICIGLLLIAEWIGILHILEMIGDNATTVIVTYVDFRIIYIGTIVDAAVLALANNRFVAHACQGIIIIAFELGLIWVFARLLPFMLGRTAHKPFEIFARQDSESQD